MAGAAGYNNRLYGGRDDAACIDWVDDSKSDGFLTVNVNEDTMKFQFVSNACEVLKEVVIRKDEKEASI